MSAADAPFQPTRRRGPRPPNTARKNDPDKRRPKKKFIIDRLNTEYKNNYGKIINDIKTILPTTILQNAAFTIHQGLYFEVFGEAEAEPVTNMCGNLPPNVLGGNARLRRADIPISVKSQQEQIEIKQTIVIKGVCRQIPIEDFKAMLISSGISCKETVWLTPAEQRYGFLKVKLDSIEEATKHCSKGILCNNQKFWCEPYQQLVRPTQCVKCWGYGHRAEACDKDAACKKCGSKDHDYKNCTITGLKATGCHCINCDVDGHPASYAGCVKFKEELRKVNNPAPPQTKKTPRRPPKHPGPQIVAEDRNMQVDTSTSTGNKAPSGFASTTSLPPDPEIMSIIDREIAAAAIRSICTDAAIMKLNPKELEEERRSILSNPEITLQLSPDIIQIIFDKLKTVAVIKQGCHARVERATKHALSSETNEASAIKKLAVSTQPSEIPLTSVGSSNRRNSLGDSNF